MYWALCFNLTANLGVYLSISKVQVFSIFFKKQLYKTLWTKIILPSKTVYLWTDHLQTSYTVTNVTFTNL